MARPRIELHAILKTMGAAEVYFQPPPNVNLKYPCIIYQRQSASTSFADNQPHITDKQYMVTVIDRDPDSQIPDRIAKLPMCTFNRFYAAVDLNHDVFTLYY